MQERKPDQPASGAEEAFEGLIQDYLIALGEGRSPVTAQFAEQLTEPEDRRRFLIVVAAEVILDQLRGGKEVDLRTALGGLSDSDRQKALEYIKRGRKAASMHRKPLAPNTLLAKRFRVQRQLASGGTAAVYLARDEEFDVDRILKAFNYASTSNRAASEWEELLRGEARSLAKLESRNIVTVFDIFRDGEKSYIVMEYLRGCDLNRVIRDVGGEMLDTESDLELKPQPEWIHASIGESVYGEYQNILATGNWYQCVARIIRHAVHALELAHGKGICHRDIKPANIRLVGGGEPVLLDFGFGSGPGAPATLEERLLGTPEYMAPEQFRQGRIGDDPRTDLYQMGVVLHELVTLRCPFNRQTEQFVENKRKGIHPPPLSVDPGMPPALASIIETAMCTELNDRYASAREMRLDLLRFEVGKPPLRAPVSGVTKVSMWARSTARRPTFLVGLAGAIFLIAALILPTDDWFPPTVSAKHRIDGGLVLASAPSQVLQWMGGSIDVGLSVDASRPSLLYAFEIYGDRDGPLNVRPLLWEKNLPALSVADSESTPILTLDGTERWPVEQILVLATEERSGPLEEYIDMLQEQAEQGVREPFDQAVIGEILVGKTRSTSLAEMSPEQLEALKHAFDPGAQLTDADYAEAGVKPYYFEYLIRYAESRFPESNVVESSYPESSKVESNDPERDHE